MKMVTDMFIYNIPHYMLEINAEIPTTKKEYKIFTEPPVMQSPGISILVNVESKKVVYFDEKFIQKFGYDAEDINAADFSLRYLIDGIQLERLDIQLGELLAGKSDRFIAYHIKGKNGDLHICYIYAYLYGNPVDKTVVQLYLLPEFSKQDTPFISFDTRELFLGLFNTFDFGTFEWIIPTNRVFWSEGVYRIYEIDGRKNFNYEFVRQFTHPDDMDRTAKAIEMALKQGENYEVELKIITAKKNIKIIQAKGNVIPDAEGRPLKLVGSIRDITEHKAIEKNLETKIEELNKSNAELEEFAYIASHDLQEPLRKITTFCDRLSERYQNELEGDGKIYLERIIGSADNMRMLIHNLLEFSRVSKITEPFTAVSMDIVAREVVNELELLIEDTGSKIYIDALPKVFSSFVLMKQLFINLVNNAIKFRKAGSHAEIHISSTLLDIDKKAQFLLAPGNDYYDISVKDNGIGFDNEYSGRIFQIFQRLHGKADYPGSGIGLAICKKIVEKHNGHIYAESKEGQGAIFHVILPAVHTDIYEQPK